MIAVALRRVALGAVVATLALTSATAASADGPAPAADGRVTEVAVPLVFTEPDLVIEYGQPWGFAFTTSWEFLSDLTTAEITGPVSGPTSNFSTYSIPPFGAGGWVSGTGEGAPTPAGQYEIGLTLRTQSYGETYVSSPAAPASLTIEPAELTVDFRAGADSTNPVVTVLSAQLTGEFVDYFGGSFSDPSAVPIYTARIPAGTWTFTVRDDAGTTVAERSITNAAGALPSAAVALVDLPARSELSAEVVFTADAAAASNFVITQAPPFDFTTADAVRTPDRVVVPEDEATANSGPGIPQGIVLVVGLLALGLVAALIILSLRLRPAAAPNDEPSSPPVLDRPSGE
jgi:hypothetical protein